MSGRNRRDFLKKGACAMVVASPAVTVSRPVAGNTPESDGADLPEPASDQLSNSDEGWRSYRADAGNTNAVPDGNQFDDEHLSVDWSVERGGDIEVAIADSQVFLTHDGGIEALDAENGARQWINAETEAGSPTVAYNTVYVSGDEVFALDLADGSTRWQTDFAPDEMISAPTVAYDGVYVVVDGALYALDDENGSVRWDIEAVTSGGDRTDQTYETEFLTGLAAANKVIYAATNRVVLAVDPHTGEEVWRYDQEAELYRDGGISVNSHALVLPGPSFYENIVHDPLTGEEREVLGGRHQVTLSEDVYVTDSDFTLSVYDNETDENLWSVAAAYNARPGAISGDTLYVYFVDADGEWGEYDATLVAFDKHDGTELWQLPAADAPVGPIRAIGNETLYVNHDGELVAFREDIEDEETGEDEVEGGEGGDGDGETDDDTEDQEVC